MFALIGAIILFLVAFGVRTLGPIDMFVFGLAFWCLHFAFGIGLPLPAWRRQ